MTSWETWFRTQSIADVRKSASKLELQVKNESVQIHRNIGERYPDAIALADRLASLKMLSEGLDSHVESFSEPPEIPDLRKHTRNLASTAAAANQLERILLSLADRSIVQHRYATAARALYFYDGLHIKASARGPRDEAGISSKLTKVLESWMVSGSFISQTMFDACLIHLKLSPSQFLETMLALQLKHLSSLLEPPVSIAEAFKAVDTTLFIYNQAVVDWHQPRLSQRRIVDMPEFSTIPGLQQLLRTAGTEFVHLRAYPLECYGSADLPAVEEFIEDASHRISQAVRSSLSEIEDAAELLQMMTAVVSQAQNSLSSADSGIATLLDACEPPFSEQLLKLIHGETAFDIQSWERRALSLRGQIANLGKLARGTTSISSTFSSKMQSLEASASQLLGESITNTYKTQHSALIGQYAHHEHSVGTTAGLISELSQLDSAYSRLDGTPEACPNEVYEHFAASLAAEYKARTAAKKHRKPRKYWSHSPVSVLFELELLIDELLPDHDWDNAGLQSLRRALEAELAGKPVSQTEATETKDTSQTEGAKNDPSLNAHEKQEEQDNETNGKSSATSPDVPASTMLGDSALTLSFSQNKLDGRSALLLRPLVG